MYPALLGAQSALTGASLQNGWDVAHARTLKWLAASTEAGLPWVVCIDEQNPYFRMIHGSWGQKLREVFESLEAPQWNGGAAEHPLVVPAPRHAPMRKIGHPSEKIV